MLGRVVGSYQIDSLIGEGGMGAVYHGLDRMLEREVAIKVLRPELAHQPTVVERFRTEAVTLARLNHPNLATLYSFLREGDELFMVMEYVHGDPLDRLLAREGALPPARAAALLAQALDGIAHAHRQGIVHRDLKPGNIMVTPAGQVKVMDFGIARVLGAARQTRTGLVVGTFEYMAPEQIQGRELDGRADLYAAGIVLYELLTGRVPFQNDSDYALMRAQVEEKPMPPRQVAPGIPPAVEAVVLKALAKAPADRFETAEAFREALGAALAGAPSAPPTGTHRAPATAPSRPPKAAAPAAQMAMLHRHGAALRRHSVALRQALARPRVQLGVLGAALLAAVVLVVALALGGGSAPSTAGIEAPADTLRPEAFPAATLPVGGPGPGPAATAGPAPSAPSATAASVEQWLTEARGFLAANQLTTPAGANVVDRCAQVLAALPGHAEALRLVGAAARRYFDWGTAQERRGQAARARTNYEQSRAILRRFPQAAPTLARTVEERLAALAAKPQTPPSSPQPSPEQPPTAEKTQPARPARRAVTLAAGTLVRARLSQTLSSGDDLREGASVALTAAEAVVVDGVTVIARGASIRGEVVEVRGGGLRSGALRFVIRSATGAGGKRIALDSEPFGARTMRGKDVVLEAGTVYVARVAAAVSVDS